MRKIRNSGLSCILSIVLFLQLLTGCGIGKSSEVNNSKEGNVSENFIKEDVIESDVLTEKMITEDFIQENLVFEDDVYEVKLEEQLICQTYTFEIVAGVTTEEDIEALLPEGMDEYEIDWPKVIGKIAVGTGEAVLQVPECPSAGAHQDGQIYEGYI